VGYGTAQGTHPRVLWDALPCATRPTSRNCSVRNPPGGPACPRPWPPNLGATTRLLSTNGCSQPFSRRQPESDHAGHSVETRGATSSRRPITHRVPLHRLTRVRLCCSSTGLAGASSAPQGSIFQVSPTSLNAVPPCLCPCYLRACPAASDVRCACWVRFTGSAVLGTLSAEASCLNRHLPML
jgi:hypothetical protein